MFPGADERGVGPVAGARPITEESLRAFLAEVDGDFPIPLSDKVDLGEYAEKLAGRATLCAEFDDAGAIAGLAAGYTEHLAGPYAYIALVGVRGDFRRRGIARRLVSEFVGRCEEMGLAGVHLYTDPRNSGAICMYEGMGFERICPPGDSRPNDVHFFKRCGTHKAAGPDGVGDGGDA